MSAAEYKWNGSDWIWTDDSKDDGGGGGGGSVQDTGGGGGGGGRSGGQGSRKFEGAGRNVSETETRGHLIQKGGFH